MDFEQSILPKLGKTGRILDLHIEEKLSESGIPLSKLQFMFLMTISKNHGKAQNCLADLTGRNKTTFTRNINTLERHKLVTRTAAPDDKRSKLVHITLLGQEYVEKSKPIIHHILDELESAITEKERIQFLLTLDKIKQKLLRLGNKSNAILNS